jgi:TolA-binding protein
MHRRLRYSRSDSVIDISPPIVQIRSILAELGTVRLAIGIALTGLVCTSIVATGCKTSRGPSWGERSAKAAGLQDAGDLESAEESYRRLLTDVDAGSRDARYIQTKLAEIAAERGRYQTALKRYRRAWDGHTDETAASARFDAARLHARQLDQTDHAVDEWFAIIIHYPNTATAERAAERLGRHYAAANHPEAFARRADAIHPDIADAMGADNLLFWVAQSFERADPESASSHPRGDAAREWYRRLLRDHPNSSMADDAHWELARYFAEHQHWQPALQHYRRLAAMYRPSWFVGSYSSPYASRARYRLGEIQLLFTDNYAQAARHFRRYLSDFPTLRFADESAWHLTHIARLTGRGEAYRRRLRRFIDNYPRSRYVRRATRLLNQSSTPSSRRD